MIILDIGIGIVAQYFNCSIIYVFKDNRSYYQFYVGYIINTEMITRIYKNKILQDLMQIFIFLITSIIKF